MHTSVYLCKTTFYRKQCDSAQNGIHIEKFMTILQPVRNNACFKLLQIYTKSGSEEEGVWHTEGVYVHKLSGMLKDYPST